MTKKDIVKTIAEQIELPQLRTKELVQKTFDALIDASNQSVGLLNVSIPASATATADPATRYFYDLQQTFAGEITTGVEGQIHVTPDVSR